MVMLTQTDRKCKQEEEEEEEQEAAAGEDLCQPSAYNRRLRATQSPKYIISTSTLYYMRQTIAVTVNNTVSSAKCRGIQ